MARCHDIDEYHVSHIRTQKARGVLALTRAGFHVPRTHLVQCAEQVTSEALALTDLKFPVFARPCPTRPRHGFVDSRICKDAAEVAQVWSEAIAADDKAEMLLMPPIPAVKSAIITPSGVCIGDGHAGATAGEGSRVYPLAGFSLAPHILDWAGIGEDEAPFIESVKKADSEHGELGKQYLVQLRAGPKIAATGNYVPARVIVREVHRVAPDYDLLAFEKWCEVHKGRDGLVIWQPGGSRLSHAAVHAIINQIPCVFDASAPEIGDTLEPTGESEQPYDASAIQAGFDHLMFAAIDPDRIRLAVRVALYGLHHASALRGKDAFWVGAAVAAILRASITACFGEYRHARGRKCVELSSRRDKVYEEVWNDPAHYFRLLPRVHHSFSYHRWRQGYGGPRWAEGTFATFALSHAWHKWRETGDTVKLIAALNRAVNQVHNGGWLFNKFESSSVFDGAAKGDPETILKLAFACDEVARITERVNVAPSWPNLRKGSRVPVRVVVQPLGVGANTGDFKCRVRVGRPGFYREVIKSLSESERVAWALLEPRLKAVKFDRITMLRVPKTYWTLFGFDTLVNEQAHAVPDVHMH